MPKYIKESDKSLFQQPIQQPEPEAAKYGPEEYAQILLEKQAAFNLKHGLSTPPAPSTPPLQPAKIVPPQPPASI